MMHKHKNIVLSLVISLGWISAYTQNTDLPQLLERGKQNFPLLKAKDAEIKSSAQKVNMARTDYIPSLTLGHQYTYATGNNVEGAFFPNEGMAFSPSGGIRPSNIYQPTFGSLTSALLDWKVVNFGKVSAGIKSAKAENSVYQADYEQEFFQYQVRLADAYLLSLVSHHLTAVQWSNLRRAENFKNTIFALVSSGLRPGIDSSLAHAEYVKAQWLLLESEKNQKSYAYRLQELVGNFKDSLQLDSMKFSNQLPQTEALGALPSERSPILQMYKSYIQWSEAKSTVLKRAFYPSISVIGAAWARGSGISNADQTYRTDFYSGTQYQVYNYLVGVALRWNLSSYPKVRYSYQGELAQKQRYQYLYESQYLGQARALKEAEAQFMVSLQQAQLAPIQLEAARQAFAQAQARYENGLTDLPTYTQSLLTLNRAEADHYVSYSNAWRALLMKSAATGDFSSFLQQIR